MPYFGQSFVPRPERPVAETLLLFFRRSFVHPPGEGAEDVEELCNAARKRGGFRISDALVRDSFADGLDEAKVLLQQGRRFVTPWSLA